MNILYNNYLKLSGQSSLAAEKTGGILGRKPRTSLPDRTTKISRSKPGRRTVARRLMTNSVRTAFPMVSKENGADMPEACEEAVVAEFIRTKGITRCPTACVLPTQGSVALADRVALQEYAVARVVVRKQKGAARWQSFSTIEVRRSGRQISLS
jgi:hypothetical protein